MARLLERLVAARLISAPAIWGKLPGHADYVRSAMRHGDSDAWQPWLAARCGDAAVDVNVRAALPVAFVLPPGALACAPRRFVVGVITPSVDQVGRRHALLVYQLAHRRWVRRHFDHHAEAPQDWLFWLARTVAAHVHGRGDAADLEQAVRRLWNVHAPRWAELVGKERPDDEASSEAAADRRARSATALDRSRQPNAAADRVASAPDLRGVRYLPWVDWPQRLLRPRGDGCFWQQDADGGFVDAGTSLKSLWEAGR